MTPAAAGYPPPRNGARAVAVTFIAAFHALAIGALLSLGGVQAVIREAEPLLVRLLPPPAPRIVEIPRSVPLPTLRPPEIRIPDPPVIENVVTLRVEPPAPPEPPRPVVSAAPQPVAVEAPPGPAPALDPPRADLAYLNNPPPAYPRASRRAGEQGRVMLRVRVTADGRAEEVEIEHSSGYPRLDEAALRAVRRWRFVPARRGEQSVAAWARVPVHFSLQG